MSKQGELVEILKELLFNRFYPKPQYIRGLLGDGRGNVLVPNRPDYNYVRFSRASTETFEVFNKEVSQPVDGLPVLLGEYPWAAGLIQVVSVDWAAYAQTGWGDDWAGIQAHGPTHEWPDFTPGSDAVNVYRRAITPMRTQAAASGSTSVMVAAYEYDGATGTNYGWPGSPPFALAAATPPSGTMRYMGVYLNPTTNTLGVVTGSTTIYTDALEPPRPAWPRGVYPSAYVRLYGGQTQINERDIRDARRLWNSTLIYTGSMAAASQAEVNTGLDISKAVTPATLTNWQTRRIKNTSGATASQYDVGYINEAGEYKTTTTASHIVDWCVVVTEGANNSDITVTTRGRVMARYTGTAPSAGHFLTTSTAAGSAQRSTVMDPAIFAVCLAAGSGGLVDVLLLCETRRQILTNSNDLLRIDSTSSSDFVAVITGTPSGLTLTYTGISSGAEDTIVPTTSLQPGKIVLWNTTRSSSGLISSVNTATNVITLTAPVPGTWVNGDAITARSQTATGAIDTGVRLYELDLSGLNLNPLTRHVELVILHRDTAASAVNYLIIHPFEAVTGAFSVGDIIIGNGNNIFNVKESVIALKQGKICFGIHASGSGTGGLIIRIRAIDVAKS